MDIKEIKKLINLITKNNIEEFELEQDGVRLKIKKRLEHINQNKVDRIENPSQIVKEMENSIIEPEPSIEAEQGSQDEEIKIELNYITSPIVGIFYRASSPNAPAYVEVGDKIEPGQVLCLIEAMKLMNEIVSDRSGEVVEIFPKNGQAVEYGEKLFAIKLN